MGAAAMIGLGLALAQPERHVLVVTGDREMLMGLGALATIGVQRPPNLAIAVFDNGHCAETGMQASHTDAAAELIGVARACGIKETFDIIDELGLREFAARLGKSTTTLFARVAIRADEPPRILPPRNGVYLKIPRSPRHRRRDLTGKARAGVSSRAGSPQSRPTPLPPQPH
jgi:thiamine pyrophosphate-dependent acetolactate synthase large subunit-like protein